MFSPGGIPPNSVPQLAQWLPLLTLEAVKNERESKIRYALGYSNLNAVCNEADKCHEPRHSKYMLSGLIRNA